MQLCRAQIHRALAFVHAAIEDPTDDAVGEANQQAADLLTEIDWSTLDACLREEVVQLTVALRTLRQVLSNPSPARQTRPIISWPPPTFDKEGAALRKVASKLADVMFAVWSDGAAPRSLE